MLECHDLGYRVGTAGPWLVRDVALTASRGETWGILGPNGAGKSTLLRMLAGEIAPGAGEVRLHGRPLTAYRPAELARQRGMLGQGTPASFPFTAYELVLLGRHPHIAAGRETPADHEAAARAMRRTDTTHLQGRAVPTLSGGEAHRTATARVLAQEPTLLLLDEPTNHLDPAHQLRALQLGRDVAAAGGLVVCALHDLNLAALFCDRLVLLRAGRVAALGSPESVLVPETIRHVYDLEVDVWRHPSGVPWVVPLLPARPGANGPPGPVREPAAVPSPRTLTTGDPS